MSAVRRYGERELIGTHGDGSLSKACEAAFLCRAEQWLPSPVWTSTPAGWHGMRRWRDLIAHSTMLDIGALGGFVCGPQAFIDLLVNAARSFIFTTAPSPGDIAAASAALGVVCSDEGAALIARLHDHVERIAPGDGAGVARLIPHALDPRLQLVRGPQWVDELDVMRRLQRRREEVHHISDARASCARQRHERSSSKVDR
jgi:hypothetical protein